MSSERGFTLLEVVASLVIISIVLLSFFPFFHNAKQISNSNMERLVIINLAEATLNRLKADPYSDYIERPSENPSYLHSHGGNKLYTLATCSTDECRGNYRMSLNNKEYFFEIKATQNSSESNSKLINIIVSAKNDKGNLQYAVEGYISYE